MDGEQAKAYIKNELENYLVGKGINPNKNFHCLNPDHPDKNPSMSFDRQRNRVHCFSCEANYDTFDLIGIDHGITDKREAFIKALEVYGVGEGGAKARSSSRASSRGSAPNPAKGTHPFGNPSSKNNEKTESFDYDRYFKKVQANLKDTEYLKKRGISEETARRLGLGFDPAYPTNEGPWQALIIPTGKQSFTARNTDPDAGKAGRIRKRGPNAPYRMEEAIASAVSSNQPVFIVEGEIDAISVMEAGGEAIALGSVANTGQLLQYIEGGLSRDVSLDRGAGQRPATLPSTLPLPMLIALDNDPEGERAAQKLLTGLKELGIKAFQVQIAEGYNDPNEALIHNREGFFAAVQEAKNVEERELQKKKERYMRNNAANYVDEFLDIIDKSSNTPAIPTGFPWLDEALDDGLFEGLYIFGAISSLGKTTFLVQMADQIAINGGDVLFFSLEMARMELMAKSLSRLTLQRCLEENINSRNAKTTRDITVGKRYSRYSNIEHELIMYSVNAYREFAAHLYYHEGIGDIGVNKVRETVENHIAITGNLPVVMIDYLQILAPYNERMTDKQNTDKAVIELKRISRDYKIPVIGVSSFNRQNYREEVTMEAFKESGAIEYSSDVLIGLQLQGAGTKEFDVNEAKKKSPRDVELKILKNRNGKTGVSVAYEYYSYLNYFREGIKPEKKEE